MSLIILMIVVARAAFMPPCKVLMWQWVSFNCRGWNPKLQQWRGSEVSKQRYERPANTFEGSGSSCHGQPSVSPDLKRIFFREAAQESSRAWTPLRTGSPSFVPTFRCKLLVLFLTNCKNRTYLTFIILQRNATPCKLDRWCCFLMPKIHSKSEKQKIFFS